MSDFNELKGLKYIENILSESDLQLIIEWLKNQESDENFQKTEYKSDRKVIQFGYKYVYTERRVVKLDSDMPEIIKHLRNKLDDHISGRDPSVFNQCIINRYAPGERITKHKDARCFGGVIACFSFGASATMRFSLLNEHRDLVVTNNSLYTMHGDARYKWSHEMLNSIAGQTKKRDGIRYSITFRIVV